MPIFHGVYPLSGFLNLFETKGYPPKIVLLRIGNMSREEAGEILIQAKFSIRGFGKRIWKRTITDCLKSYNSF